MAPSSKRSTWYYFLALLLAGVCLESSYHEMHLSKMLIFASFGVWARELPSPWVQLGMVAFSCAAVLGSWYAYRHQHLVPLGKGVYRLENERTRR